MKHIITAAGLFFVLNSQAQETVVNNKNPFPTSYVSEVDRLLNLKSVALAPTYDNVGGVYKAIADKKLNELVVEDHTWYLAELKLPTENKKGFRADWFEEKPEYTKKTILNSKADSLLSAIITKSSSGLTVNLILYVKDGSPLISVTYQDGKTFETSKVNEIITDLYAKLKQRLPYYGMVMSRKGNIVTINLGQKNGIKENDKLTIAQILSIKRHPKLKFMTNIEKEVIGQVVVTKVDSDLCFAQITFEKEIGVIEKGSKLLPLNFVDYRNSTEGGTQTLPVLEGDKEAQEWLPTPIPQFGKISLALGISDFKLSSVDQAGAGTYTASQSFAPTFKLGGELWINSEWYAGLDIQRSIFSASNGLSGSSPGSLSFTHDEYDLILGYRYAITGNFWGPQLHFGAGFISSATQVTDSAPVAFTSNETNGLQLQLGGYFPITDDNKTSIGARAKFILFEKYSESPVNSGKASSKINKFGLYVVHQLSTNIQLRPEINYSLASATFGGAASRTNPVRSTDENMVSYLVGIEYLF